MTNAIARINDLRAKVIAGEELTQEEAAEAIQLLRTDREEKLSKASGGKQTKLPTNLGDLFTKEESKP